MRKSKLITLTLALALVLSTVFAGAENVFAETNATPIDSKAAVMKAFAETDENTVTAENRNTVTSLTDYTISYGNGQLNGFKVTMPVDGTLMIDIFAKNVDSVAAIYTVDENDQPGEMIGDPVNVPRAETTTDYYILSQRVKAGTYYVVIGTQYNTGASAYVSASYAPAGTTVTPKAGKNYYASNQKGKTRYFKVKASSAGYITIDFPYGSAGTKSTYKVKLMNSSKSKNLLKKTVTVGSSKDWVTYAAVPKGTYYVAVTSSTDDWYAINLKATKVKENSGSSKSKAKSISKGGTKKGTVTVSQSSSAADWYKIKVGSNQKVFLDILTKTGGASGGIRVTVYSGSKKMGAAEFYNSNDSESYAGSLELFTTINGIKMNYLQKGTYYIKVTKYGSGNGYYQIKWR